jgi:hypothetical protein
MTRDDLTALIARVEAATGPDRELDAASFVAITPGCVEVERRPPDGLIESDQAAWLFRWKPRRWSDSWRAVPRYTASLDAALTLANDWVIASLGDMVADGLPGAVLLISTDPIKHATGIGYGTRESGCLARALTAAALRARLASMGDDA